MQFIKPYKVRFIITLGIILCLSSCGKKNSDTNSSSEPDTIEVFTEESSSMNETSDDTIKSDTATDSSANSNSVHKEYAKLATPSTTGRLKVSGTRIIGENGQEVQLRGISTHGLGWFPEFVNNEAFGEFRNNWGANVIRLALYTSENNGYCTDGDKNKLLNTVYKGVEYATANDMYVIIDWHVLNDNNPNKYKGEALEFWDSISKKYANNNNVIYEICNEPCGDTSWTDIKNYANEIIPEIRTNDPNAIIVVGTPTWSQDVDKAASSPIAGYDNIMYTLHFYAATHKDDLQNKMINAIKAGLPIMVTEFGICDASGNGALDIPSANKWVKLMNDNGISYICWNLSNKSESSALIKSSCNKKSGFEVSDLSDEGKWLYELLRSSAANGVTPLPEAESSEPHASDTLSNNNQNTSDSTAETTTFNCTGFLVTMTQTGSWTSDNKNVVQYTCRIENKTDNAVNNWDISIDFDTNISLNDGWNGNYKTNGSKLDISNKEYNGTIKSGESINDVGFIVTIN